MTRVAIISDVHADVHAVADALERAERLGCDAVVCARDLVDCGLFPDETIALLRARAIPCIRDNHDRWRVAEWRAGDDDSVPDDAGGSAAEDAETLSSMRTHPTPRASSPVRVEFLATPKCIKNMAAPFQRSGVNYIQAFQLLTADYVHNLLVGTSLSTLEDGSVHGAAERLLAAAAQAHLPKASRMHADDLSRKALAQLLARYVRTAGEARRPRSPQAPAGENVRLIAKLIGLTGVERDVLRLIIAAHTHPPLGEVLDYFGRLNLGELARIAGAALRLSPRQVMNALGPSGRLLQSGLVSLSECGTELDFTGKVQLKDGVADVVLSPDLDRDRLLARFLTRAGESTLSVADMTHLGDGPRTARELLSDAIRTRRPGVNVLLYGPTGTGKTELARLLATQLGCTLFGSGQASDSGGSAEPSERLSSLMLGHRLLERSRSLLMFDELEDLFSWDFHGARRDAKMSKLWFNRLLEHNPVPTIWISNDVRGVDPAFLRRFEYAIEFQSLSAGQRARILQRHLGEDSRVSPSEVQAVASQFASSPAQYASAVRAARAIAPQHEPTREHIERVLLPIEKLMTGREPVARDSGVTSYQLDVLNTAQDLTRIADQLAVWRPSAAAGVALCLYGPPGTGKSAYADHLALRMGQPLLRKRASDLLGPYVGQTEAALAAAFREAERDGAVLLLDEADSFMRNRRSARQTWEATLVNEFLQQLERFRGLVVCTTNLASELDEAAARRFTFNIEFRHLRTEQAVTLFERVFAPELVSDWTAHSPNRVRAALVPVTNLAPGDYAALARRTRTLGLKLTVDELISGLLESARAKSGTRRSIGFAS